LEPGPTAFVERPEMIYAVFIVFLLANVLMVPFGIVSMNLLRRVLDVPRRVLMPAILLFCVIGAFAVENTMTAVYVTIGFGVVGLIMESNGYPLAPLILGMVLGPLLEDRFITSMAFARGDLLGFFERPLSATLGVATLTLWALMIVAALRRARRRKPADLGAVAPERST